MMKAKRVMTFRILPAVVFRCPECDGWMRIERVRSDTASSERYCGCGAMYRVVWGESEPTTLVEMIRGKLA